MHLGKYIASKQVSWQIFKTLFQLMKHLYIIKRINYIIFPLCIIYIRLYYDFSELFYDYFVAKVCSLATECQILVRMTEYAFEDQVFINLIFFERYIWAWRLIYLGFHEKVVNLDPWLKENSHRACRYHLEAIFLWIKKPIAKIFPIR